ncbi:MAG: ABC transporter permease [Terriglobia bacterium]|jgi:hypothetical protein
MNAKTTRILKEARPLLLPWCAVNFVGALPLVHKSDWTQGLTFIWFIFGIPLLATISLGSEFQHRTLTLLLTQPVRRMEIWSVKLSVTLVAVLSAVLVGSLGSRAPLAEFFSFGSRTAFSQDQKLWVVAGAWILAAIASATFWTLFARSTIGGLALNTLVLGAFNVPGAFLVHWIRATRHGSPAEINIAVWIAGCIFLCYGGVMLWLGRRTLARYQVTGGMAGDDLLMAGPDVLPGALAGWLRCRPSGVVLNLIRKEIRLLRPVWIITLLYVLGETCITMFRLVPERGSTRESTAAVVMLGGFSTLIAVLAGCLSLGEERASGTHSWHMTLPMPALRQWLIKLFMALFAGILCAALLPVLVLIAGGFRFGSPFMFVDVHTGMVWLIAASLLTFASFWCACAVNGTVPAALWVLPVMIALNFAGELGKWAGPALTNLFLSRFDPFANVKFADAVSHFGSKAFFKLIQAASTNMTDSVQAALALTTLILVPPLLYAVIQSYRLFRAQLQDRALSVLRSLLPLAMTAFLCSFFSLAFYTFVSQAAQDSKWTALFQIVEAIQKVQSGVAKLDAAHPAQLTVEDLAKASTLSKSTRRFLGDSHITLALDEPPHHGQFGCGENPQPHGLSPLGYSWYSAIIPLADGSRFVVAFDPVTHSVISVGICGGQLPPFPGRVP